MFQIHASSATSRRHQHGAALFVALMLLLVMSILALSASQVTSLQERMASTYRADELAFERGEARLRETEDDIANEVDPCFVSVNEDNSVVNNPVPDWQADIDTSAMQYAENLSRGPATRALAIRGSLQAGKPAQAGDPQCMYFRVSARDFDTTQEDASTSTSIVQSIYVP